MTITEENMSNEDPENKPGAIMWRDLTVENAVEVRDFYCEVAGWTFTPFDMGDYEDYNMLTPRGGQTVAGVCHARGSNASLPPQWLIYVNVEDLDRSAQRCVELGGKLVDGPRSLGGGRFCVIQDPAGAVCALIEH